MFVCGDYPLTRRRDDSFYALHMKHGTLRRTTALELRLVSAIHKTVTKCSWTWNVRCDIFQFAFYNWHEPRSDMSRVCTIAPYCPIVVLACIANELHRHRHHWNGKNALRNTPQSLPLIKLYGFFFTFCLLRALFDIIYCRRSEHFCHSLQL